MVNFKVIGYILGILLLVEAAFLFICIPITFVFGEDDASSFLISGGISLIAGGILWLVTRDSDKQLGKRDGYIIVSLVWVVFSIFGALPFYISNQIPSYTDSFFETISGFTTTGASILNDIESLSHGMLFWRSLTQWLGGMGIIVLSLAILPVLGIGGMQLFIAEVPGPTPDKLHPRVTETAKRLWGIYIIFTSVEMILLFVGGMPIFDSVCHAFTTMATGGYSTKQASIAYYSSPFIQYVITVFMFIAGINFTLSYFALHRQFKKVWRNEEFRTYLFLILAFTLVITIGLFITSGEHAEKCFRDALFQVVSITTTTGYATSDYLQWFPFLTFLIFLLMFVGGSAGSTGGGIKVVRVMLMFKNSLLELKRLIHPNAVIPVRLNNQSVPSPIVINILAFIAFYLVMVFIGMMVMSTMGYDIETSVGAVAATIGNIGPGIGAVGPVENYAHLPDFGKWFLSFLMLIGRLELFTVLVIFTRTFWKE
jgi:trk system potassium uptake protein TrkH